MLGNIENAALLREPKPHNIDQPATPASRKPRRSQADLDALRRRLETIKRQSNAY